MASSWTETEDDFIVNSVQNGFTKWSVLAKQMGTDRSGKQVRERWFNHLDPTLCKAPWTLAEDNLLRKFHEKYGNKWSKISSGIPGRSENSVRNRWNSAEFKRLLCYAGRNCDTLGDESDAENDPAVDPDVRPLQSESSVERSVEDSQKMFSSDSHASKPVKKFSGKVSGRVHIKKAVTLFTEEDVSLIQTTNAFISSNIYQKSCTGGKGLSSPMLSPLLRSVVSSPFPRSPLHHCKSNPILTPQPEVAKGQELCGEEEDFYDKNILQDVDQDSRSCGGELFHCLDFEAPDVAITSPVSQRRYVEAPEEKNAEEYTMVVAGDEARWVAAYERSLEQEMNFLNLYTVKKLFIKENESFATLSPSTEESPDVLDSNTNDDDDDDDAHWRDTIDTLARLFIESADNEFTSYASTAELGVRSDIGSDGSEEEDCFSGADEVFVPYYDGDSEESPHPQQEQSTE